MEHWLLDCPALSLTRTEIFGHHDLNLDVFATSPKQDIALVGHSLVHWVRCDVCDIVNNNNNSYTTRQTFSVAASSGHAQLEDDNKPAVVSQVGSAAAIQQYTLDNYRNRPSTKFTCLFILCLCQILWPNN